MSAASLPAQLMATVVAFNLEFDLNVNVLWLLYSGWAIEVNNAWYWLHFRIQWMSLHLSPVVLKCTSIVLQLYLVKLGFH